MKMLQNWDCIIGRPRKIDRRVLKLDRSHSSFINYNEANGDSLDCDIIIKKSILKVPFSFKRKYSLSQE